jgi:hypothetical protein
VPQVGGVYTVGIVAESNSKLESAPLLVTVTLANGVAPNVPAVADPAREPD